MTDIKSETKTEVKGGASKADSLKTIFSFADSDKNGVLNKSGMLLYAHCARLCCLSREDQGC